MGVRTAWEPCATCSCGSRAEHVVCDTGVLCGVLFEVVHHIYGNACLCAVALVDALAVVNGLFFAIEHSSGDAINI